MPHKRMMRMVLYRRHFSHAYSIIMRGLPRLLQHAPTSLMIGLISRMGMILIKAMLRCQTEQWHGRYIYWLHTQMCYKPAKYSIAIDSITPLTCFRGDACHFTPVSNACDFHDAARFERASAADRAYIRTAYSKAAFTPSLISTYTISGIRRGHFFDALP